MKKYRNNGAIGAMLDEYEKAIVELQELIGKVTYEELKTIVDQKTDDTDCRSIQTILTHVICSGKCYVIEIRKALGEQIDYLERKILNSVDEYQKELNKMFDYNVLLFKDYPELSINDFNDAKKILVRSENLYNLEQLFEHAIVHILRHRRQIERFLIKLKK